MSASLYAIVDTSGNVTNMVEWDAAANPTFAQKIAPLVLVSATGQPNAQIGGTYLNSVFTAPAAPTPAQTVTSSVSPLNGATVQVPTPAAPPGSGGYRRLYYYLQPSAPLTSLTLALPPNPQDGDVINIRTLQAVTGLVFTPTFQGAPASLASGPANVVNLLYSVTAGNYFVS